MAQLIVERVWASRGILAKQHVILDGVEIGVLKNGQTLTYPIAPGNHTLLIDPKSMMVEKLGPYNINVGQSDIRAVIDPGTTHWHCEITGSANSGEQNAKMARLYDDVLASVMQSMDWNNQCNVYFFETYVQINGYRSSYSGGMCLDLDHQWKAASELGMRAHDHPQASRFKVYVSGRGVEFTR